MPKTKVELLQISMGVVHEIHEDHLIVKVYDSLDEEPTTEIIELEELSYLDLPKVKVGALLWLKWYRITEPHGQVKSVFEVTM